VDCPFFRISAIKILCEAEIDALAISVKRPLARECVNSGMDYWNGGIVEWWNGKI